MKILLHYPGIIHKEYEQSINNMEFKNIIKDIFSRDKILEQYQNEDKFYSRFITLKNGRRFYSFNNECDNNDLILIIAANKIKRVQINEKKKESNIKECSDCKDKEIFYIDTGIFGEEKEIGLCKNCLKRRLQEKAFNNIEHFNITNDSIIDFGISGERDSTIALYFLTMYRKIKKMKFKINCVFNAVGLGEYDKNRMFAAKDVFQKFCSKEDKFNINNLNLNFEADFKKNRDKIDYYSSKYCSICTRANGYRDYGIYNGKDIFTASGSGTIEDDFANKVMNKGEAFPKTMITSKIPKTTNFRRILILDGILEDIISIYALIEKIDYCVADCPLSCVSPNYLCRENSLNLIKAKTKWIISSHGDNTLMQECSILGSISKKRKIPLLNKCVQVENNEIYGVRESSIQGIEDCTKNKEKPDDLEINFYQTCMNSKQEYLDNNYTKYLQLFSNKYVQDFDIVQGNCKIIALNNSNLIFNMRNDTVNTINLSEIEKNILRIINEKQRIKCRELFRDDGVENKEIVSAIQKLLMNELVQINLPQRVNTQKNGILYIFNHNKVINETYKQLLKDVFNTEIECIEDIKQIQKDAGNIILIIEEDAKKIKEWYKKLIEIPLQVIYVHFTHPMTIFTNDYEYIQKNWTIDTSSKIELSQKEKNNYKAQLVSVLSEIMLCDFNIINKKLKKYNILYYINIFTGERKKQLF